MKQIFAEESIRINVDSPLGWLIFTDLEDDYCLAEREVWHPLQGLFSGRDIKIYNR